MRLKKWVVYTLIMSSIFVMIGLTIFVASSIVLDNNDDTNSYVLRDLLEEDVMPVVSPVKQEISKPFEDEGVEAIVSFYDLKDKKEVQEKSLILYGNTYIPSTGILYSNKKEFSVHAIYPGKVTNIEDSEAFGKVIEITHENDFVSKYSSVKDIKVNVGDMVSSGDVIGTSSTNKVSTESENMLYFELILKGENVNPEKYYETSIEEE